MFNFLQCGLADALMKLKGGRIYAMMTINILKFLAANARTATRSRFHWPL
jgi:hypothetical protein